MNNKKTSAEFFMIACVCWMIHIKYKQTPTKQVIWHVSWHTRAVFSCCIWRKKRTYRNIDIDITWWNNDNKKTCTAKHSAMLSLLYHGYYYWHSKQKRFSLVATQYNTSQFITHLFWSSEKWTASKSDHVPLTFYFHICVRFHFPINQLLADFSLNVSFSRNSSQELFILHFQLSDNKQNYAKWL